MFLIGTEMDYIDNDIKSEFVFNNPNEKGKCGCGESFNVWLVNELTEKQIYRLENMRRLIKFSKLFFQIKL